MGTITVTDKPNSVTFNNPNSTIDNARFVQIDIAPSWDGPWTPHQECEVSDLSLHAVSEGIEQFTFQRRYGKIRWPYDPPNMAFRDVQPWNEEEIEGCWVRVSWLENAQWVEDLDALTQCGPIENGYRRFVAFVGQIQTPKSTLFGGGLGIPSGVQSFTAYGVADYLRRIPMSTSLVENPASKNSSSDPIPWFYSNEIDWVMTPNVDSDGEPFKNRSLKKHNISNEEDTPSTYIFGEGDYWTTAEYITYLARLFSKPGMPPFRYEFETEIGNFLKNDHLNLRRRDWETTERRFDTLSFRKKKVELSPAENVLSVLQKIFDPDIGLDFAIRPYVQGTLNGSEFSGFAIRIFSRASADGIWQGTTFPKNESDVKFDISHTHSLGGQVSISRNQESRYRNFRLVGDRIKVVCSFSLGTEHGDDFPRLVPGWKEEDEEAYRKALWSDDDLPTYNESGEEIHADDPDKLKEEKRRVAAELNDAYRDGKQFRDVYSLFLLQDNFEPKKHYANPEFDSLGYIEDTQNPVFQFLDRKFIEDIPYFEKDDNGELTGNESVKVEGYYLTNAISHLVDAWKEKNSGDRARLRSMVVLSKDHNITFEVLQKGMGIRLNCNPRHYIAGHKWDDAAPSKFYPSEPLNWQNIIVTLSWESDHRLAYEAMDPDESFSTINHDLGTLSVDAKGCELWYYAPMAYFGELDKNGWPKFPWDYTVEQNGHLKFKLPELTDPLDFSYFGLGEAESLPDYKKINIETQIGRNDLPLLTTQMAALMAKHGRQPRAVIPLRGEWPVGHFIGTIISEYQDADFIHHPETIITRIQYSFGKERTTTIYAGGAR